MDKTIVYITGKRQAPKGRTLKSLTQTEERLTSDAAFQKLSLGNRYIIEKGWREWAGANGSWWCSHENWARLLAVSEDTVQRAVREAKKLGILTVVECRWSDTKRKTASVYTLAERFVTEGNPDRKSEATQTADVRVDPDRRCAVTDTGTAREAEQENKRKEKEQALELDSDNLDSLQALELDRELQDLAVAAWLELVDPKRAERMKRIRDDIRDERSRLSRTMRDDRLPIQTLIAQKEAVLRQLEAA